MGTSWGPHALHVLELPPRPDSPANDMNRALRAGTLTPPFWGSRGRRFKSCRPDAADEGGVRLGWTPSYLRVWGEPAILVEMSEIHLKITI